MADRDLIAEGRAKLAAATPGPWDTKPHSHLERGCRCLCCHDAATVWWTTNMLACNDVPIPEGLDQERCEESGVTYADAELIAHMRNTYEEMLDELADASARVTALKAANTGLEQERDQLAERVNELAAQRNPDDEVLVEGSWFHPADLPKILGNFMRSCDQWAREAKGSRVALDAAQVRITELEQQAGQLRRLVEDFTDPGDCRFDHNHSCQEHGFFYLKQGDLCPHEESKQLLAQWEEVTDRG